MRTLVTLLLLTGAPAALGQAPDVAPEPAAATPPAAGPAPGSAPPTPGLGPTVGAWGPSSWLAVRLAGAGPQHEDLRGFDTGVAYEVAVGYEATPHFAVEAAFGRTAVSGSDYGYVPAFAQEGDFAVEITAFPLLVTAKLVAPVERVKAYALAGVGLYVVDARISFDGPTVHTQTSDRDSRLGVHVGVGMVGDLAARLQLGAELRYVGVQATLWDDAKDLGHTWLGVTLGYRL